MISQFLYPDITCKVPIISPDEKLRGFSILKYFVALWKFPSIFLLMPVVGLENFVTVLFQGAVLSVGY